MSDAPVTLVTGPRGAYAAEALAAVLERQGRWQQAVWLRTSAWSRAAVASELAMACMHRWARPDVGEHIPLRAALHLAPLGSAVVVELGRRATPQVGRLLAAIRPTLVERASSLVVGGRYRSLHAASRHAGCCARRWPDLRSWTVRACRPS
jgi:hypothetical protein